MSKLLSLLQTPQRGSVVRKPVNNATEYFLLFFSTFSYTVLRLFVVLFKLLSLRCLAQ